MVIFMFRIAAIEKWVLESATKPQPANEHIALYAINWPNLDQSQLEIIYDPLK